MMAASPALDAAKAAVTAVVASDRERLLELSHRIHAHPEIAWEEHQAAGWVADAMTDAGFAVTTGYLGLDTAVRAELGSGPMTVVVCAEYDALPGLGHACGHNIIAASSVGAARALAAVADDVGLRVVLLGTPAEEGGGGKIRLLDAGAFDDVHLALMAHPGPVDVAEARPYAVSHSLIRYIGQAAHAAAYPEQGRNAADAFTVAQVAIGLLRQQLPESARVHGIVTHGGDVPNAIPERTEGRWYVRADTGLEREDLEAKVHRCFEAGALATGCTLQIEAESPPYSEFLNDVGLVDAYRRNAREVGRRFDEADSSWGRMNRASTDMGNVSQRVPALHPYIGIDSAPAVNHQREFAAHCITAAADRAVVDAATALAWTVVDAATDPALRARLLPVRQTHGHRGSPTVLAHEGAT
jgi:amidohydrolase